jgi:recombination protein RecA
MAKVVKKMSSLDEYLKSGDIMAMSSTGAMDLDYMSSGIRSLDVALGAGIPRGRIVEVFGSPSGGKSAIALRCAGVAQGFGRVLYLDLENTLDPSKAENSGVDIDELLIAQPGSTEDTLNLIVDLVSDDSISMIVVDSVASMVPLAEIHGEIGDASVGVQARLMSQGMRNINQKMVDSKSKVTLVFVNQTRDTIGGMGFGPKSTTTGGKALKFYASVRIDVARTGSWKVGDEVVGQSVRAKVVKNKYFPPFKTGDFRIHYEHGVADLLDLLNEAVASGFVVKSGAYFKTPEGDTIAQGEMRAFEFMLNNPDFVVDLETKLSV